MKINNFFQREEDSFLKNNVCIFKKYKPIKKIGFGSFGNVYLTKRIKDGKLFAMKTEKNNSNEKQLEEEAYFLYSLQGFGIPKFISYGKTKNYKILIETLLDKSLNELMKIQNRLSLKDVCLIGIQILDRLEWIHSKNIIYRDIKPQNFLIGKDDPNVIYIIDFGLCKKYRSSKTGKHILPRNTGLINGTIKYASSYVLSGKESSRRDDLIALGYMLIYLYRGSLPWELEMKEFNYQIFKKIVYLKRTNSNGTLFNNLPKEFAEYINYNNNLKFEQEPDYKYLHSLFNKILFGLKFDFQNMSFSWITSKQINLFRMPRNNSMRKSNSHSRLYKKIVEKSAQRAKSESNEKYHKNNITNNNRRNLNISPIPKIKIINNVKKENNINFKNNEEMVSIQINEHEINKDFKCKKIILKKKIDNSNYVNNSSRNNDNIISYNSNNSNNNINSTENYISHEAIVNISPNKNNKINLFFKNQYKLRKKNKNFNEQKFPINIINNNNSNNNIFQKSFFSSLKKLNDSNSTKIDYILNNSNKNTSKEEKIIKNNINNSFSKSSIQKKNLKMIPAKKQINKNIYNQKISLSNYIKKNSINPKLISKNIHTNNNLELNRSSINQNKNLSKNNIKVIYINNNYNFLKNKDYKIPISHFSNSNIINADGRYSLEINQRNKFINLKNKNILNKSPFQINSYNLKPNLNNTYKSIFKRNEKEKSPFSEYIAPIYDKLFENN